MGTNDALEKSKDKAIEEGRKGEFLLFWCGFFVGCLLAWAGKGVEVVFFNYNILVSF